MNAKSLVAVAVAVGLLLALPVGAAARRPKHRGPSPKKVTAASILVHNSFANAIQDEFAGPNSNYADELERCHEVEAESGELRTDEERTLRENIALNLKVAENFKGFNSRLPGLVRTFRGFRSRLRRANRRKLNGALARLTSAHTAHEHEFFDLRGIWVQIESVNCATAEELEREAKGIGTHAWTREFRALVEVAHLFKVRRPLVEYPVGPYVLESSG